MEEYAIIHDYKKVLDHRDQKVNGRYKIDAEEIAYWRWIYQEEEKQQLEPESEEPF